MYLRIIVPVCLALWLAATVSFSGTGSTYATNDTGIDSTRLVVFCDEINDDWNPVNPVMKIKAGEGVNFLVKLKEGLAVTGMVWDIFKVGPDGKDAEPFKDFLMMSSDPDQKFRYWGTTEKTFFPEPGTYRVYLYPKNRNSDIHKTGNWTDYSAKGELVVE
jgi:hypothetical protein